MKKEAPNTIKLAWKTFKTVIAINPKTSIPYFIAKNATALIKLYKIFIVGKLLDSIGDILLNLDSFSFADFFNSGVGKYFFILVLIRAIMFAADKIVYNVEITLRVLFETESREDIMSKISNLNLEDVEKKEVQTLISSVQTYSIAETWNTFLYTVELISNIIIFMSVGWVVITQISPWAMLVTLFVLPEALYRYKENRRLKDYRDENARRVLFTDYVYQQATVLNNFSELRVDNVFKFLIDSYDTNTTAYDNGENRIRAKRDKMSAVLAFADRVLLIIVQMFLIPISIANKYTLGQFKYLFDYLDKLYSTSWHCIWKSLLIRETSYYVKDYFDLIEYQGFGDIVSGNQKLDSLNVPSLEFINVDFSYPDSNATALEDISLNIEPGEKVAIVGDDDSGKSTIAKLLCGLYRIGPGDILIDNISVRNLERGELKDKVAVVFEDYVRYDFSIRKNITLSESDRDFSRRRFEEALEITGLDKWIKQSDFDENQVVGKALGDGIQISSGHWQRIAIARALYRDRQVLILDESLTQIDESSRKNILDNIIKFRPKQTLIYITQDYQNTDLFDKIIEVDKGKISEIKNK